MDRTSLKLLVDRSRLAQGSMALVDKQLSEILSILDNELKIVHAEAIRGEEEKSEFYPDFFISPPAEIYDE